MLISIPYYEEKKLFLINPLTRKNLLKIRRKMVSVGFEQSIGLDARHKLIVGSLATTIHTDKPRLIKIPCKKYHRLDAFKRRDIQRIKWTENIDKILDHKFNHLNLFHTLSIDYIIFLQ